MKRFAPGSFFAGAVLAGALTVGGLAIAHGDGDSERGGMMGGEGMMGMMSQMQEMMSRCNAMMDNMGEGDHGGMMSPERRGGDES